jgi:hypothetical protein
VLACHRACSTRGLHETDMCEIDGARGIGEHEPRFQLNPV